MTLIRASWLVLRQNICSLRSFIRWLVTMTDRLKQWKLLGDEHTKTLRFPSVQIMFLQMQKSFLSILPKRVYQVPVRMYSKLYRKKPAKFERTSRDKVSKQGLVVLSENNHLRAKKRRSGIRKRITTHKSCYSSSQQLFSLTWSSLFFFLLLHAKRVWIPSQLQSSQNFQSINLHKFPRPKVIRLLKR